MNVAMGDGLSPGGPDVERRDGCVLLQNCCSRLTAARDLTEADCPMLPDRSRLEVLIAASHGAISASIFGRLRPTILGARR